jgi:hypothetical protein
VWSSFAPHRVTSPCGSPLPAHCTVFEFVRGHKHALDSRKRNAMVRDLCIDDPPDVSYTLGDLEWGCDLDAERHDSVESLRILIQHVLLVNEVPLSP